MNGAPREVIDAEQTKWSCVEASTARPADDEDAVTVVCTPSGGAQSVRVRLAPHWAELSEDDLLAAITRARKAQ